jgi:GYF domain 2
MTHEWYYGRGADITGPVSRRELADLAAGGHLLPTDTVWRDGVEEGAPADQVEYLFSAAALIAAGTPDAPAKPSATVGAAPAIVAPPRKTGRAVAGKGAVLVGQDGATVKYRGKCTTCGREDASWKSIAIPRGTHRSSFFCAKCRKRRDVELYGYQ